MRHATKKKQGKRSSGGEPSKRAKTMTVEQRSARKAAISDGHDHKRGNIGPSGQGSHRGRERSNVQTSASGRPNVSAASHRARR